MFDVFNIFVTHFNTFISNAKVKTGRQRHVSDHNIDNPQHKREPTLIPSFTQPSNFEFEIGTKKETDEEIKFSNIYPYRMSIITERKKVHFIKYTDNENSDKNEKEIDDNEEKQIDDIEEKEIDDNEENETIKEKKRLPNETVTFDLLKCMPVSNNFHISRIFLNKDMERAHLYYVYKNAKF